MKKFGFTLTEVLITLGIIGVIAAITTPALHRGTGQAKIGPALAKFANTMETASSQLLNETGLPLLTNITNDSVTLMDRLSEYIIMSRLPDATVRSYSVKNPNGSVNLAARNFTLMYQLKDGSTFAVENTIAGPNPVPFGAYKGPIKSIYYDINGLKGTNIAGKEVFLFWLDNTGALIPYGSVAQERLSQHLNNCSTTAGNVNDGYACTGKIADNNWVADY